MTDAPSMPSISGRMRSPDAVGLTPLTICMNSGRKVSAPNMANPMTKPMALAALKTRSRKSFSGITGSAATALGQEEGHGQHHAEDGGGDARHGDPGPRDPARGWRR